MTSCKFCGAQLYFDDMVRGRNGNRRPLNADGSPHDCAQRRAALDAKRRGRVEPPGEIPVIVKNAESPMRTFRNEQLEQSGGLVKAPAEGRTEREILLSIEAHLESIDAKLSPVRDYYERQ